MFTDPNRIRVHRSRANPDICNPSLYKLSDEYDPASIESAPLGL